MLVSTQHRKPLNQFEENAHNREKKREWQVWPWFCVQKLHSWPARHKADFLFCLIIKKPNLWRPTQDYLVGQFSIKNLNGEQLRHWKRGLIC